MDHQAIIDIWQPLSSATLTSEDAREIAENLTGFFRVLDDWKRQDALSEDFKGPELSQVRRS